MMEDNLLNAFNKAQRGLVPAVETYWSLVIGDGGTYQYPNHVVIYVTRAGSCEHFLSKFGFLLFYVCCFTVYACTKDAENINRNARH